MLQTLMAILAFFLPMTMCGLAAKHCPILADAGSKVWWRPSATFFGVIWTVLFVLIGVAWARAMSSQPVNVVLGYVLLSMLLVFWIITYSPSCTVNVPKKQTTALWILVAALTVTAMLCVVGHDALQRVLLVPLVIWLFVAMLLSTAEHIQS